jgi:hypothetical protein
VFKDWSLDSDETTDWIYSHDTRLWKADKFVKDEDDLAQTLRILKQNIPLLKVMFIEAICRGNSYPGLSYIDFSNIC